MPRPETWPGGIAWSGPENAHRGQAGPCAERPAIRAGARRHITDLRQGPDILPAGRAYREEWTGIPAFKPVTSARYGVWPE